MAYQLLMEREPLVKLWEEAWAEGLWAAAWSKTVEGLPPEQAAWKPQAEHHSIWQIVNHILFWREITFRRLAGGREPEQGEVDRRNWEEPTQAGAAAWEAAQRQFAESHQEVLRVLRSDEGRLNRLLYHLAHDSYHIGQIMYLRAMLGLPPIE